MRPTFFLFAAVLVLSAASAPASTIANFEIVTASGLSPIGGTFNDGGTFGGTFSVDLSDLPGTFDQAALPAVDITTTQGTAFAGNTYTSGTILWAGATQVFGLSLEEFEIRVAMNSPGGVSTLIMAFVETPGTFVGGQILEASETVDNPLSPFRQDLSGDAIAVDPALVPEPGSVTPCALALLAIWLFRRRNPRFAA